MMSKIKCIECVYCIREDYNGSPSRCYCTEPSETASVGSMMICRCLRGTGEMTIKSSPVWCPRKLNVILPRVCRVCGCTDYRACIGGCYWVEDDLCSCCSDKGEN